MTAADINLAVEQLRHVIDLTDATRDHDDQVTADLVIRAHYLAGQISAECERCRFRLNPP